jgi:hypothetical protein
VHFTNKTFLSFFTSETTFAFYHLAVLSIQEEDSMLIRALRQCSPVKQGVNPIMRRFNVMALVMILLAALFFNSGNAFAERLVVMGDGTVFDSASNLRWLKNANCFDILNWDTAMTSAANLASPACGLTDGSISGDWRLPTIDELSSLASISPTPSVTLNPTFNNTVQSFYYWSGSTNAGYTSGAWVVDMTNGRVYSYYKTGYNYVWPVRAGQVGYLAIDPVNFGDITITTTSASQTLAIRNSGTVSVTVTDIILSGGDAAMFALDKGDGTNGTCGAAPTLATGASCTISATFSPTSTGAKSTTLRISSNAANSTSDTPLSGTGKSMNIQSFDPNVSWWKAENNANDSIGANHGTLHGAVGYTTGKAGQAFSFDGSAAQYISIPSSPSLNISGDHTVSFWVRPNALPTSGYAYPVVSKWANGIEHKQVQINASGTITYFLYGTTAASGVTSTATLQPGVWSHVVATYDGAAMKIYINGARDASTPANNDVGDGAGTLYLGYNPDAAFAGGEAYFNGLLDEVGWYNRALSQEEVSALSDITPDPFSFTARTDVPQSTIIESNAITVTGVNASTAISITGGEYAVSTDSGSTWGSWTSAEGTVCPSNQVKVHLTSSESFVTLTTATLTIGGVSGAFHVTTLPMDTAPDPFSFTARTGVPQSTNIVSNAITVTGINASAEISISGGEYAVSTNGGSTWGSWTSAAGSVSPNNQVKVRLESSTSPSTLTTANLTIGGITGEFNVTTVSINGLVAWWKAENNANDSVGGNNGTVNGATFAAGKTGQALGFDGTDDHVAQGASYKNVVSNTFTMEFWANPAATRAVTFQTNSGAEGISNQRYAIFPEQGGADVNIVGAGVSVGTNGVSVFEHTSENLYSPIVYDAVLSGWTHIAVVYTDKVATLYVNGALVATGVAPHARLTQVFPSSRFGGTSYGYYRGALDEVRIFNRALTSAEIEQFAAFNFNAQNGVARNTEVVSNSITIIGISDPAAISITSGEYQISTDGGGTWGGWTSSAGSVGLNNRVRVRLTSSASFATQTAATLTIEGKNAFFSVTTLRFVDLGDGTVLDGASRLRWLKNANCQDTAGGIAKSENLGTLNWASAQAWSDNLTSGLCGLTDGSIAGDWHLSTIDEMTSISSIPFIILNSSFQSVLRSLYWSSSSYANDTSYAWFVGMGDFMKVDRRPKYDALFVWPVRDGQWINSAISATPASRNFGSVTKNTTSASQTFTISNGGAEGDLAVSSISLTGGDSAMFALNKGNGSGGTCGDTPTLDPGASCTISATFTPTSYGARSTTLRIASNDTAALNKDIALSGTGAATLTVTISGSGGGTVTSDIDHQGILCPDACQAPFAGGSVTLSHHPSAVSTFGGWSGACTTDPCIVAMDGDKTVTATFTLAPVAKNITKMLSYSTLATALSEAASGDEIRTLATQLDGAVTLDKAITLSGGWKATYFGLSGLPTTLNGDLTIQGNGTTFGSVDVKGKLVIQRGNMLVNGVTVRP